MTLRQLCLAALAMFVVAVGSAASCSPKEENKQNPAPDPAPTPDPTPSQPSDSAPAEFDGYADAQAKFFDGLSDRLTKEKITVLHIPPTLLEKPSQLATNLDCPDSTLGWMPEKIGLGHRQSYLEPKGMFVRKHFIATVTGAPAFAEVLEEEYREELLDRIWASQDVTFDPDTALEIGKHKSAKAALFTRITASHKALRPFSIHAPNKYWVKGEYQFEARLVNIEKGTIIWFKTANWYKYFTVAPY